MMERLKEHKRNLQEVAANSNEMVIDTTPSLAIAAARRIFQQKIKLQTTHFHQRHVGRPPLFSPTNRSNSKTLFTFFFALL